MTDQEQNDANETSIRMVARQATNAPPGSIAECAGMVQAAIAKGVSGDALKGMMEVYQGMHRFAAEAAYAAAMVAFQRDCPPMPRGHRSPYKRVSRAGVQVDGRYSDTADIGRTIGPILAEHGLAWDWERTEIEEHGGVRCYRAYLRIRHEQGHAESKAGPPVPIGEPVKRGDGTAAQDARAHASAVITTAQRLALKSAFGLWSIDPDEEDAAVADELMEPLTAEQRERIDGLIAETKTDPAKLCKILNVKSLDDLREHQYARAVNLLNWKKRQPYA